MSFVFSKSCTILNLDWFVINILIWAWIFNNFHHFDRFSFRFLYCSSIYFAFRQIIISVWSWNLARILWGIFLSWFCWFDSCFFHWLFLWPNIIKSSRWISIIPLSISFPNTILCNCCKINCRVFIWAWNLGLITIRWRSHSFREMILCLIKILILWKINLLL